MLSYRHQGDYFEGDKVSFKYEGRNTRFSPTLVLCQRGHRVWLYSMDKNKRGCSSYGEAMKID